MFNFIKNIFFLPTLIVILVLASHITLKSQTISHDCNADAWIRINTSCLDWQDPKIGIFYSQFIVDRFYEWYYPVAAFQFGYKSFDFAGVENLYLQIEYNRVPREMYLHRNNYLHFGHYNQALAHPAGACFNEVVAIADYKYKNFKVLAKPTYL